MNLSRGGLFQLVVLFLVAVGLSVAFQNCASNKSGDGSLQSAADIAVNCTPTVKPCLKYKVSVSNLQKTHGAMSVLVNGMTSEGVSTKAEFSKNCKQINTITALCPINEKVTATIKSDATDLPVKGDGRTLKVSFFTSSGIRSGQFGQLSKVETNREIASEYDRHFQEGEKLCFSSENYEVYDGDLIPAEAFVPCEQR